MYINCTATFCQHKFFCTLLFFHCRQRKQNLANTLYFQHTYKSIFYNRKHTISLTLIIALYFNKSFERVVELLFCRVNALNRGHGWNYPAECFFNLGYKCKCVTILVCQLYFLKSLKPDNTDMAKESPNVHLYFAKVWNCCS